MGRVRSSGAYEQAGVKTPDVAIDAGEDLTLIEVVSVRLPLGVRAEDDPKTRATYLRRALLDKLEQLSDRIDDLLAGRISIPDVQPGEVKRIWPVLVSVDDIVTSEALRAAGSVGMSIQASGSVCKRFSSTVRDLRAFAGPRTTMSDTPPKSFAARRRSRNSRSAAGRGR